MKRKLALCAALAALIAAVSVPAAGAAVPRAFYGLSPQVEVPERTDFERMGNGGVGTFRFVVSWPEVQPTRTGAYRFRERVDREVERAAEQGMRILPVFYGTPDWIACPYGQARCRITPPLRTDAALEAWQRFVAAAARRYGPNGFFWNSLGTSQRAKQNGIPATEYQIWNEQNSFGYWNPGAQPRAYGKLVKASARAIRAAKPGSKIVLGGMFGTPPHPKSMTAWGFLNRLYDVPRIKAAFDMVAAHPYSPGLRGIRYQMNKLKDVIRRNHDRFARMWITEIGWGSAVSPSSLTKGLRGQARMLRSSFRMIRSNRFQWRLRGLIWFSWNNHFPGSCQNWCSTAGLVRGDGTAKPAWAAYKNFTPGP